MSASPTKDASQDASEFRPPLSESKRNDLAVTTQEENQDEKEHTPKDSQEKEDDDNTSGDNEEEESEEGETKDSDAPPLPDEIPPPLPNEAPPAEDDGWEPVWDSAALAYYFYNRYTGASQWHNPRVPDTSTAPPVPPAPGTEEPGEKAPPPLGGYNPAIHGDYDPTAPYAQQYEKPEEANASGAGMENTAGYDMVGSFNRFTGRWQGESQNPEYHNDENKSRRQMYAFFDVDAAANSHDGRSLRAERSAKKLSKQELKAFKEKRREKKEEKRRAWLRD
ncbi:hypothetical protein BDW59DRAFT_162820 [Aspergillus cavernicola]|uniref:WW domain-containing protein n=1 Tax=Aspergillus cavernicola TaxID=176166 RepID=A0ABR4I8S0_9EURO